MYVTIPSSVHNRSVTLTFILRYTNGGLLGVGFGGGGARGVRRGPHEGTSHPPGLQTVT